MEPLLKYIIYFLLGIICYYLLKEDLIEGNCEHCKALEGCNGSSCTLLTTLNICGFSDNVIDPKKYGDIIVTPCNCSLDDYNHSRPCQSTTSQPSYCNASNTKCTQLLECNGSSSVLKIPCYYKDPDPTDPTLKMCKVNQKYVENNCSDVTPCTQDTGIEIQPGEECICTNTNSNSQGVEHLCKAHEKCTSASGCISKTLCGPLNGAHSHTYTKSCPPPDCKYYSDTNNNAISSECICDSESRHSVSKPFVCPVGNYCFDHDSGVNKGCNKLPVVCTDDTLINASCVCPHEISDPQPHVCGKGNYCSENRGCYKTDCPGQKINLDNKLQCIDNDHEKDLIERFTDELNEIFHSFINIFK